MIKIIAERVAHLRLALSATSHVGNVSLVGGSSGGSAHHHFLFSLLLFILLGMEFSVFGTVPRPGSVVTSTLNGNVPRTDQADELSVLVQDNGVMILESKIRKSSCSETTVELGFNLNGAK